MSISFLPLSASFIAIIISVVSVTLSSAVYVEGVDRSRYPDIRAEYQSHTFYKVSAVLGAPARWMLF
jgi:hypothetical protein